LVKVTQNLSELHLTNSNDDSGCRSSQVTNNHNNVNHRSKTGNKNSFKVLSTQMDVALSDVNLAKVECVFENDDEGDGDGLLVRTSHLLPIQSNVCISISPPLTSSKSENNIFEKNLPNENPSHFNVVSLSDLSDDAQYCAAESEHYFMNDLSKTQVLNRLSDEKINGKMNRF
jgi:hypothetical protein